MTYKRAWRELHIDSLSPPGKKGSSWVNDCKAIGGWVEKNRPGFGWVRMATAAIGPSIHRKVAVGRPSTSMRGKRASLDGSFKVVLAWAKRTSLGKRLKSNRWVGG